MPVYGILDSGTDITIMGGPLYQRVATVARPKKHDLRKPEKTPWNYDQTPFSLDGCMELDVAFGEKTIRTSVYIKGNAHEQLLLSDGVCRQLGFIQYHPDVQPWRRRGKQNGGATSDGRGKWNKPTQKAVVPTVSVRLVQSVRLPPNHCAVVPAQVRGKELVGPIHSSECSVEAVLLEAGNIVEREYGLNYPSSLIAVAADQSAQVVVVNNSGFTQHFPEGVEIGHGTRAVVPDGETPLPEPTEHPWSSDVQNDPESADRVRLVVAGDPKQRKQRLLEVVGRSGLLDEEQAKSFDEFLVNHHEAFSVKPGGRVKWPPLHPIPVSSRPFQIVGIDVMELRQTEQGNRLVLVLQDLFSKLPMVLALSDQKTERIVQVLVII